MNLILAAKAHAVLRGSNHVAGDDVVAVATPILRHRLILNFAAQSEGDHRRRGDPPTGEERREGRGGVAAFQPRSGDGW